MSRGSTVRSNGLGGRVVELGVLVLVGRLVILVVARAFGLAGAFLGRLGLRVVLGRRLFLRELAILFLLRGRGLLAALDGDVDRDLLSAALQSESDEHLT